MLLSSLFCKVVNVQNCPTWNSHYKKISLIDHTFALLFPFFYFESLMQCSFGQSFSQVKNLLTNTNTTLKQAQVDTIKYNQDLAHAGFKCLVLNCHTADHVNRQQIFNLYTVNTLRQEQQFTVNVLRCLCRNVDCALRIFHTESECARDDSWKGHIHIVTVLLLLYSSWVMRRPFSRSYPADCWCVEWRSDAWGCIAGKNSCV